MAASYRHVILLKLYNREQWVEYLAFFSRQDAEDFAASLRAYFKAVEDAVVVQLPRSTG